MLAGKLAVEGRIRQRCCEGRMAYDAESDTRAFTQCSYEKVRQTIGRDRQCYSETTTQAETGKFTGESFELNDNSGGKS